MNYTTLFRALALSAATLMNLAPVSGQDFVSLRRASAPVPPPPSVTLRGIMTNNLNWSSTDEAGVYTFPAVEGAKLTCLHRSSAMSQVVAAVRRDQTMYAIEATFDGFFYRSYSTATWAGIGSREEIDVQNVAADLTWDPVTEKCYGGFYDEDNDYFSRFGSFNLTMAEATEINTVQRDERDFYAIAAAPDGTIYALFGAYNYLATVDPRTGALERIATTGLKPTCNLAEARVCSMCYDDANDRLLAVVYSQEGTRLNPVHKSALYSIDPATAVATKITDFDGAATFAGLEVIDNAPSATSPAAPTGLKIVPGVDGDDPTVEFDVPLTTVGGAPLTGEIMAIVLVNGAETVVGGLKPGEHAVIPNIALNEGDNTVKVTLATATERGASAETTLWVGDDVPSPVSDLRLAIADGKAVLTWKAPTTGVNGGSVDPAKLNYHILRFPDRRVMSTDFTGTTFTDATANPEWKTLYYQVTAYNAQGTSEPALSNRCPASGALDLPFTEGFDTSNDFDAWTVEDCNGSVTWGYSASEKCAYYDYPRDNTPGDDWLITPPLRVEGGKTYKVSYKYRAYSDRYPESLEVMLATAAGSEAMTVKLAEHTDFINTRYDAAEATFRAETSGVAYIGFHAVSKPKMWQIYLDDITVEAVDSRVPAAVADLKVTPDTGGAVGAAIAFTAPATDVDGNPLASLTKIEVFRDDIAEAIATFDAPAAGAKLECHDSNSAESGIRTYSVVASNAIGRSAAASQQAFIGTDAPGAPENVKVTFNDKGQPVITWDTPSTGLKGGWYDPATLTTRIIRSDGSVVSDRCKTNTFTDVRYKAPDGVQGVLYYVLTSWGGSLHGGYVQSETVVTGTPYKAPIAESFKNADMAYYPWLCQSATAVRNSWTLDVVGYYPPAADQNADGGLATFHGMGEVAGTVSWFYSPKFDISTLERPVLTFWMYHSPATPGDGKLEIFIAGADDDFKAVEGAVYGRTDAESNGWTRHSIDLAPYAGMTSMRLGFKATGDAVADIYIDNLAIDNSLGTDAAISGFTAPARFARGETVPVEVRVLNAGTLAASSVAVTVTDGKGNTLVSTTVDDLAAGEERVFEPTVTLAAAGNYVLTATATVANDEMASNNSVSVNVEAVDPVVTPVTGLEILDSTDGALLRWKAPSERGAVTDDFESYPNWAISGVGEWSMYDGDYNMTYYINSETEYENANARKAFQVLNVNALGIDIWDQGKAHSGNKLMAAMACVDVTNNDWLISPRLNGAEQWVSFYARSFTTEGMAPERMLFYTSQASANPSDFVPLTPRYLELDGMWREFRYFLPEGTRYFAIVCVSHDSFAMFVDDVNFNDLRVPAWTATGYEVWRNGEKVADTSIEEWLDAEATDGDVYTVRPVYGDKGTGPDSDSVTYAASGVGTVDAAAEIEAYVTVDGRVLPGNVRPAAGIYIARYSDGTTVKVAVR